MAEAVFSKRFIMQIKRNQAHYDSRAHSLKEGLNVVMCASAVMVQSSLLFHGCGLTLSGKVANPFFT